MITLDRNEMLVKAPSYPSDEIKLELGGRWDKKERAWRVAPTSLNVLRLIDFYGPKFIDGAPEEIQDLALQPWGFRRFSEDEQKVAEAHPSWDTLYWFQREGVEWLFGNPHGAGLCALSWGMGKGAVATVTADLLEAQRILVLAPLTLAPAWIGELERWSSRDLNVKRSVAGDRAPGPEVTIANHEVIQETILRDENNEVVKGDLLDNHAMDLIDVLEEKDAPFLKKFGKSLYDGDKDWTTNKRLVAKWIKYGPKTEDPKNGKMVPARRRIVQVRRDYLEVDWDLIIVDESVMLKNRKAVKVDVLGQLRKRTDPYIFFLSGSPITKHRDDLWAQLKTLYPKGFSSYWRFAEFFCVVDKTGWGWTIEGDHPEHNPHHYLRDMIWVKSQDEALPDLPEYIETPIQVEGTPAQQAAMKSMLEDWIIELEEHPEDKIEASNWLSRNTRLQQITSNMCSLPRPSGGFYPHSSAKEDLLVELIRQDEIQTPLLVWSWYVETTRSIQARLLKEFDHLSVGSVVGADSSKTKDQTIAAYKAGQLDVLVMQMGTGKFGHTFTHTQTVFYHDRSMDSDAYVQSLARVRRIGLKHEPVLIIPKMPFSADPLIDLNLEGKLGSMAQLTNANLARLLRSLG